jgi:cytochrome b561
MPLSNTEHRYGAVAKFLHWAIVILIIAQYVIIESAEDLPDGLEKLQVISNHKSLGMLVFLLALARIGWRIVNRGKPVPVPMPDWQRIAAAAGHGVLYLLILAMPLSGWAMSSSANYPVTLFGWFQFPALVAPDPELHEALEEVHEVLFNVIVALAIAHAAAALYHHFALKDDTLRRMLPFARRPRG